jgi:uncharacterized RDD family membrane protein YckC
MSRGLLQNDRDIVRIYITSMSAALLYYPILVWYTGGQTIGKKLVEIRVIRADGRRIGFVCATWREVGLKFATIELINLLPLIGIGVGELVFLADGLWPLWDREGRALHDMLADTRVVDRVVDGPTNGGRS